MTHFAPDGSALYLVQTSDGQSFFVSADEFHRIIAAQYARHDASYPERRHVDPQILAPLLWGDDYFLRSKRGQRRLR